MRPLRSASILALASIALSASAQNLVQNGDFSLGNVGFASGLTYSAPTNDALFPEGRYTLATNTRSPFVLNSAGIADYNERTTGKGLAMFVNGATTGSNVVWSQTITGLSVGQLYGFATFVSRWTPNQGAAAQISVTANGLTLATFQDPTTPGVWMREGSTFVAPSTSVTFQILNSQQSAIGNDFALDDISVQAVPEPASMAALGLGAAAMLRRRKKA